MADKIVCGGLMERGDLSLVEILGFDWHPGQVCGILGKFGQAEISLSYLGIANGPDGDKNMSFCLSAAKLAEHRHLLDEIQEEFNSNKIEARAPMSILTLYGPHFLEKHNLASGVFSAMCTEGINAHTVCSSVNSISVVVDAVDRDRTVECLRQKFVWPE